MRLVMELKSDALPGCGEGLAGIIDTDINYDQWGLPYIPSKRVKGILREAAEELADAAQLSGEKTLAHSPAEIFGEPGRERGTTFKIADGRLENHGLLQRLLRYGRDDSDGAGIFSKEAVLDQFSYFRSQTAINALGVARENSLRTSRVLKKGMTFYFDLEIPDNCRDDLETICRVTRRFGINRTRGLGEIGYKSRG